mgnify:CR=1 FL=1
MNFQAHSSARSYKKNISEYDIMKRNNDAQATVFDVSNGRATAGSAPTGNNDK